MMDKKTTRGVAIGAGGALLLWWLMRGRSGTPSSSAPSNTMPAAYDALEPTDKTTWALLVTHAGIMLDSATRESIIIDDDYWISSYERDLKSLPTEQWGPRMREQVEEFLGRATPNDNFVVTVAGGSAGSVMAVTDLLDERGYPYSIEVED